MWGKYHEDLGGLVYILGGACVRRMSHTTSEMKDLARCEMSPLPFTLQPQLGFESLESAFALMVTVGT